MRLAPIPSIRPWTLLLLLLLTGLAPLAAAQWQTGVGGNAARDGLTTSYGPQEAQIAWQGSRPTLFAQQAVVAEGLVVVSRTESFTIPTGTWIVAHELATGDERWAVQLPYDFPGSSWRSRVSAIRDGQVYASRSGNTNEDYLYALDPADGSILWRSEALIGEGSTESLAFAPNGDPIAGSMNALTRIDHTNGQTVWSVARSCPTSDGALASVYGNRAYIWEASPSGPVVTAFDLDQGARLFSSAAIGGGLVQQLGLFCGPDGTVYAPRTQNNPATDFFVALADTGGGFAEKWRLPLGYVPFASFAVGPDGSVYSYDRETDPELSILRLDPESGAVLDKSPGIRVNWPAKPRLAIDALGTVYCTNGSYDQGALYAFTADLLTLWSESVPGVNLGGPALAANGTLIVCGTGTDLRAYAGSSGSVVDDAWREATPGWVRLEPSAPNPFRSATAIAFELPSGASIGAQVLDAQGRVVRHLLPPRFMPHGRHELQWDGRDDRGRACQSGVYLVRLRPGHPQAGASAGSPHTVVEKLVLSR